MEKLENLINQAEQIVSDQKRTQHQKNVALAGIMSDMEDRYQIPMLQDQDWEKAHPDVIRTYRQISDMRR